MSFKLVTAVAFVLLFFSCGNETEQKKNKKPVSVTAVKDTVVKPSEEKKDTLEKPFKLTEENALAFFFDYDKNNKEDKVRITTKYGSFVIDLYEETPYHRSNFIFLTKKGYFNGTLFHRVVHGFIIQGGNSDRPEIAKKRSEIGQYLLPPDAKKGFKHHRGTVSMPSSEIENAFKMASPYEFFIVVTNPGSYHLDGKYTPFGRVIEGMDVVDKINAQKTDSAEWPYENIEMTVEIIN